MSATRERLLTAEVLQQLTGAERVEIMSTKQNPGKYDCYARLADDEPYFVLRAKDPHAPVLVELWVALRQAEFGDFEKLGEALECARQMRAWFQRTGQLPLRQRTR